MLWLIVLCRSIFIVKSSRNMLNADYYTIFYNLSQRLIWSIFMKLNNLQVDELMCAQHIMCVLMCVRMTNSDDIKRRTTTRVISPQNLTFIELENNNSYYLKFSWSCPWWQFFKIKRENNAITFQKSIKLKIYAGFHILIF